MLFIMLISDDGQSFITEIYNKHHKRMLYYATQILGVDYAEDAVHEAFIKIITHFSDNFEVLGDKPKQFFVIVTRNHAIDMLRKEHLKTVPFEEEIMDVESLRSSIETPEDAILNIEAVDRLALLIRKLTPATRQVLEYRFIEGYSNKEIAEMMKISQTAVSTCIDKARKKLRALIEGEVSVHANK